jgi:hypothetical protein
MALKLFQRKNKVTVPAVPITPPVNPNHVRLFAERDRTGAPLAAIGYSGIVNYGGVIDDINEYDRAWQGEQRDITVRRMLDDPVLGAVLLGVESLMRRVAWRVDPADESKEAADIASFVDSCLSDMDGFWPGDTMGRVLTYLGWGWSLLSVGYKQRTGRTGTQPSRYDDGKIGWDQWMLVPQQTRGGWAFDERGRVSALLQDDPQTYKRVTIPLDRAILFKYGSRTNSPEGATPLRVAYAAWYRKTRIELIEGIGTERDLAGLPVMRIPGNEIKNRTTTYTAAQEIVTGIRRDAQAGLVISSDRDPNGNYQQTFELVTAGGARQVDTDAVIRRYANELVTVFFANVMRTGQDGSGSFALAETQGGLMQQALGAHLDMIGDAITSQEVPRLLEHNGMNTALAPTIAHEDVENVDLTRLGTYLTNLATAGLLQDTPELRVFVHEIAGLPTMSVKDIKKQIAEEEAEAERVKAEMEAQMGMPLESSLAQAQIANPNIPTPIGPDALAAAKAKEDGKTPTTTTTAPPKAKAITATEQQAEDALSEAVLTNRVRLMVDSRGELSLSDLLKIQQWWKDTVPSRFQGLLDADLSQPYEA